MKFSIIIPTWNSMPEIETCLQSILKNIPDPVIEQLIIVDRNSTDGTRQVADQYDCIILTDTTSLGSARMKGIQHATSDIILFVDSDIAIPPDWFNDITKHWDDSVGMAFGRTIDSNKYGKIKQYKIERDFGSFSFRELHPGDRGFTHNTFIRKSLIENLDISEFNAWEDYIITQHILKQGYKVIETADTVTHLHSEVNSAKVGWNIQGILQVKKSFPYAIAFWFYYLYEGLISTLHFKDLDMLRWGIVNWLDGFRAFTTRNAR